MLEKDCNGNPNSTFPPCYAFQMIFTALAPRLILSISRNDHDKFRALKQLWHTDGQADRHRDSMTDPAQRAVSVKNWKCQVQQILPVVHALAQKESIDAFVAGVYDCGLIESRSYTYFEN